MNNDDIILLAIEHTINGLKFNEDGLLRFANLIAKHEREKCADIAENWNSNGMPRTGVAAQIRARGQA